MAVEKENQLLKLQIWVRELTPARNRPVRNKPIEMNHHNQSDFSAIEFWSLVWL